MDYEAQRDILANSTNPFAVVILAHLEAIKTKQDEKARYSTKLHLTRNLYERGWNKQAVCNLYAFIDYVMALSAPLELQYLDEIERIEKI